MPGHSHNPSHASANTGNTLSDRSSVRQSKLYRQYESGNDVKDILGTSHLQWRTDKKEGVYDGHTVYDHNKPYNESSALAPVHHRGQRRRDEDYDAPPSPRTVRHSEKGLNKLARQDQGQQTSLSQSFQNKMNIQRTLELAKSAVAGDYTRGFGDDLGGTETIRNLSPLRGKQHQRGSRKLVPLAPHLSGRVGSTPSGPPKSLKPDSKMTAAERMRLREATRSEKSKAPARRGSQDSEDLTAGLEEMTDEQLARISGGMEELKKMALDAERQSRLDALKEELELLKQESPVHRRSPGSPRHAAYSPPDSRCHSSSVTKDADSHDSYTGAQDYSVSSSSMKNIPLSPTKGILKRADPPQAAYGNDRDRDRHRDRDDRYAARYDHSGKEIVERRYGADEYRPQLPPINAPRRDVDRESNRDKARGSYEREGDDDRYRGAIDPYASPRSKRLENAREQNTSPENKLAIQELRKAGGKFFSNDFEGGYSTSNQRTYRAPQALRSNVDPDIVFGVRTARDQHRERSGSIDVNVQLSPSQKLQRSCPFATQSDLEEINIKRAVGADGSTNRPSHPYPYPGNSHNSVDKFSRDNTASAGGGADDDRWNQKTFTNSKQPYEPRTFASESKRVTRPW